MLLDQDVFQRHVAVTKATAEDDADDVDTNLYAGFEQLNLMQFLRGVVTFLN